MKQPNSASPVTSSVLSLIKFYDKSSFLKTGKKNVSKQKISPDPAVDVRQDGPENSWEKSNSIDEFLQLVNKTKKKYKELMEKDFDHERDNEIRKNNSKNTALNDRGKEKNNVNQVEMIKPSYNKVKHGFLWLSINNDNKNHAGHHC